MFEPIDRVMNMRKGGSAVAPRRTVIAGQDHMLSYITPQEGEILMALGGSGRPGPMGIPSFVDGHGAGAGGGTAGDATPFQPGKTFYRVPVRVPGGSMDEQTSRKIYIGSEQDTRANRILGSSDLASVTQDFGPGFFRVNPPYDERPDAQQAAQDPDPDPDPDPDDVSAPLDPDPDPDPTDPLNVVVDPMDVLPELQNIPTSTFGSDASTYQAFTPDFTPPPILSIQDILSTLPTQPTYQAFTPDFTSGGFKSFAQGGAVEAPRRTDIRGQDHMLSYITPQEAGILQLLGGSGEPGPMGIPAFRSGPGDMGAGSGDVGTSGDTSSGTGEEAGGYEEDTAPAGYSTGVDEPSGTGFGFGMHDDFSGQQNYAAPEGIAMGAAVGGKDYGYDLSGRPQGPPVGNVSEQLAFARAQRAFNERMGITDKNPYGKMGFFSRAPFNFDPKNIDYTGIMGLNTRRAIANNQFSKFSNPQNVTGMMGYNPAFATAPPGQLRAGVQKAGFDTKFGKVVGRNREMTGREMFARGLFSLAAPFPMGLALSQIGTKEYGIPGLPGMERFGVKDEPPGLAGQIFGAMTGGVPADQAYDKAKEVVGDLVDRMSSKDIEAVAKATPEQQQQIQENVRSSSTQDFSEPDIFDFGETIGGEGDGPEESRPEPVAETIEDVIDENPYSGGYYDYGRQSPSDKRIIIPVEEILSNPKYFS